MDTHNQKPTIDLSRPAVRLNGQAYSPRQVFIPTEVKTKSGTPVFRTIDQRLYARLEDGSIRRAMPKARGKSERRKDKKLRRHARD